MPNSNPDVSPILAIHFFLQKCSMLCSSSTVLSLVGCMISDQLFLWQMDLFDGFMAPGGRKSLLFFYQDADVGTKGTVGVHWSFIAFLVFLLLDVDSYRTNCWKKAETTFSDWRLRCASHWPVCYIRPGKQQQTIDNQQHQRSECFIWVTGVCCNTVVQMCICRRCVVSHWIWVANRVCWLQYSVCLTVSCFRLWSLGRAGVP